MPYTDKDAQREYQRKWIAKRRKEWFDSNGPCVDCGSSDDLQLDHLDPNEKLDHRIWSWSAERIKVETSKCVVRCRPCHVHKTVSNKEHPYGERHGLTRLTEQQVREIRRRVSEGDRQVDLAVEFGVKPRTVSNVVTRDTWKHI